MPANVATTQIRTPAKKVVKKTTAVKSATQSHPPYADMIKQAVKQLKERNGSSRQAIIKYIKANYKVDARAELNIRRSLISAVKSGKLVHTKGTGASGSFKLTEKAAVSKQTKVKVAKKPKTPKKATTTKKPKTAVKKSATKKTAKPKAVSKPKVKTPKKKVRILRQNM